MSLRVLALLLILVALPNSITKHEASAMALTPFFADPWFSEMERQMGRTMAPFFNPVPSGAMNVANLHPMDVIEHPNSYAIMADAPGMSPEDIKVELRGDTLLISGEKRQEARHKEEKAGWHMHRQERTFTKFSRSFVLPDDANMDGIHARMENGVLTVDIPKMPAEARPPEVKRIRVTSMHAPGATSQPVPTHTTGATATDTPTTTAA